MDAKAASGDALLVPSDGAPVTAHSQYLTLASSTFAAALQLAKAEASEGELLRVPLPSSTQREATLLAAAIYTRQLDALLDSLPAARLTELANVCHRFGCEELLAACDTALLRKVERGAWLKPANALSVLGWAQSRGLPGVRLKAAEYAASHLQDLVVDKAAAEAGDNVALLAQCLQRQPQSSYDAQGTLHISFAVPAPPEAA